MAVSRLLSLWVLFLLTVSATSLRTAPRRSPHEVDIYNGTALAEYVSSLRRVLVQSGGTSMPGISVNSLGRMGNPLRDMAIEARQTCTGNQNNYCFGNDETYCSNCGVCCTQSAGGWCCVNTQATCCPADTGKPDGQQGCCYDWQSCDSVTGCTDPTTTLTTTITSVTTKTTSYTAYVTNSITNTVWTTLWKTFTQTSSGLQTATDVTYVTVTSAPKMRRAIETASATSTLQDNTMTLQIQAPTIAVYSYPEFDPMARRLHEMGVVVKRQNTITSWVTKTTTSTSTVSNPITSTVNDVVKTTTSTTTGTITSVTFVNAETTVQATSTITVGSNSSSSDESGGATSGGGSGSGGDDSGSDSSGNAAQNSGASEDNTGGDNNDGGGGLSTGAKAGIGIAAAAGALIVAGLLFFGFRRAKKNKAAKASLPPEMGTTTLNSTDPEVFTPYGVGAAAAGASQRDSMRKSATSLGRGSQQYQAVPQSIGSPGHPAEMPSTFQYAPYELYDEHPQELYNRNYDAGLRMHEAPGR